MYRLISSSVTFPRHISSELILACSDNILVDNCSEDISIEKKATEDLSCLLRIFLAFIADTK